MDYKKLAMSLFVVVVIGLAFGTWHAFLNTSYSFSGGATINTTYSVGSDQLGRELTNMNTDIQNSDNNEGTTTSGTEASTSAARNTFNVVKSMLTFVPNLFGYAADALGVPFEYRTLAQVAFTVAFMITLAYLLFLGVKSL